MGSCIRSSLGALASIAVMVHVGQARAQSFELADEYSLSQPGVAWTAADFDGDGDSDLAIVTQDGGVATAFNDGRGAFSVTTSPAGVPIGADDLPGFTQAVAGDFDGDGAVDLVISSSRVAASGVGCEATLVLNQGAGTFGAGRSSLAVSDPADTPISACTALNAGDYDGDGVLDFALAFYDAPNGPDGLFGHVDVFRGNGDGTFAAPVVTAFSDGTGVYVSFAMDTADFDGDGRLDLALGEDIVYRSGPGGQRVQILSGDGTGHFTPTFTERGTTVASSFVAARASDVTNDGRPDLLLLAAAPVSGGFGPSELPVVLGTNTGGGELSTLDPVSEGFGSISFESADFNADENSDLLVVSSEDRATLALGDGHGAYGTRAVFATGGAPLASLAADFDADGRSDFAVLDASRPAFRVALAQPAALGFTLPRVTSLSSLGDQVYVAPADYDGDGKLDVLVSESGAFDVLLGTGDGRFTPGAHIASNAAPARPLVADLNDDGTPDLVLPAPGSTFQTLFGSADGTFSGVTSVDTGVPGEFGEGALGDFDEDGDLDVAAFRVTTTGTPPRLEASVRLYVNDGAANFALAEEFPLTTVAARLVFADLNGDSHLDLFVGSLTETLSTNDSALTAGDSLALIGDGTGAFTTEVALPAAASQFEVGDVNGDGRLDLVTTTSLALGNGDGTFGPLTAIAPGSKQVALGDIDDDGALDVVTLGGSSLTLLLGNGDGTFAPATPLFDIAAPNPALPVLGMADFTGDAVPDLFFARASKRDFDEAPPELVTIVSQVPEPPPATCPPPHGWPPHGWPPHGRPLSHHHRQRPVRHAWPPPSFVFHVGR